MKSKFLLFVTGLILVAQTLVAQVPSYVPTNGLVGYWPFNGNANDQTPNGNNGTVNGATLTTDRFGNSNSAYNFDGISNYITVLDNNVLNMQNFTISTWVKNSSTASFIPARYILNKGCNSPSPSFRLYYQNDGIQQEYVSDCWVPNRVFQNGPSTNNLWTNIIYSYDGQNLKMYVDGVLYGTTNQSGSLTNNNNPMYIGCSTATSNCPQLSAFYAGKIDDIGIWNRALSQQEITNMYNGVNYSDTCNAVNGSLVNGLVAYYPFCGNANDQSGNGLNGVVNGATLTTDRFGNANSAYNFSGTTNNITLTNSQNIVNGSFSVSAWCTIENLSPSYFDATLIGQFNGQIANDRKWLFGYRSANTQRGISYYLFDNSGNSPTTNFATLNWNPSQSSWYHIVWVFNSGNSIKTYINGILNSDVAITLTNINNSSSSLLTKIGNGIDIDVVQNLPWNGKIDDVGIWNRALTPSEVTQLYNQNQCFTNITVTDTLIINVGQLSYTNPIAYSNNISIAPNPASTQININFNNITDLNGGTIKIINSLGQQVATTPITTSGTNTTMSLATWGGNGMYFVQIINPQGQIVDIKKIILQ